MRPKHRNKIQSNVACGMIIGHIGKAGRHSDKRNRRGTKDQQWKKDLE